MAASKPPAIVLSSWLSAISSRSRARSGGVEFGLLGVRAIVREGVLISVRRRTCSCSISLRKAESISGVGEESGELLVCKSIEGSFLDFQLLRQQRCHHFEIGVRLLRPHGCDHRLAVLQPVRVKLRDENFAELVARATRPARHIAAMAARKTSEFIAMHRLLPCKCRRAARALQRTLNSQFWRMRFHTQVSFLCQELFSDETFFTFSIFVGDLFFGFVVRIFRRRCLTAISLRLSTFDTPVNACNIRLRPG